MHRFFPIRVAEKNINRATSVGLFGARNNDGIPNLCVAIAHNFLSNIHEKLFTGYTKLAIGSCIAVDLELQLIVTRHGITFPDRRRLGGARFFCAWIIGLVYEAHGGESRISANSACTQQS